MPGGICPLAVWRSGLRGAGRRVAAGPDARGREVLEAIAGQDYGKVIVVSHGAILAAAFKALLDIPAERHPFMLENASLSRLEIDGPVVRLQTLNKVWHLSGIGLAGGGDL